MVSKKELKRVNYGIINPVKTVMRKEAIANEAFAICRDTKNEY